MLGVEQHDRCFGYLDGLSIGNIPDDIWISVEREKGIVANLPDPVANLVILFHIKRLTLHHDTAERKLFAEEIEALITEQIALHDFDRATLERADRITAFCDGLAFDFCFEDLVTRSVLIYPNNGGDTQIGVEYRISQGGVVEVDPWPFWVEAITGYIIGYQAEGYPKEMTPLIVPYTVQRKQRSVA